MKRIAGILCLIVVLCLSGCGKKATTSGRIFDLSKEKDLECKDVTKDYFGVKGVETVLQISADQKNSFLFIEFDDAKSAEKVFKDGEKKITELSEENDSASFISISSRNYKKRVLIDSDRQRMIERVGNTCIALNGINNTDELEALLALIDEVNY